jgi:hypothetical protein
MSHRRGPTVNSQMPKDKPPALKGAKGSINQYPDAPFSAHPHMSGGPGGLPVKIMESHGEKVPTDHPPSQNSSNKGRGTPPMGKRRW